MLIQQISSAQNPKIKELLQLKEKSRTRRETSLFVTEGTREIHQALEAGYEILSLFVCREIAPGFQAPGNTGTLFEVTPALYSKIAYREGTEGVIAILKAREHGLENIVLGNNPLVIVLESVEKPGNLGAVLRTADAVGADAVIVCDPLTDIYNPNIIRSSLGGVFTNQIAASTSEETYKWLRENDISILTAQLQDSVLYYHAKMTSPTAIVLGAESDGLSGFWREKAHLKIMIPMVGKLDSLNVSVSAAVLCYEALRQRDNK
jgi:TrmH family RNA methyltransferase